MSKKWRIRVLAVLLALGVVASACGGRDGSDDSASATRDGTDDVAADTTATQSSADESSGASTDETATDGSATGDASEESADEMPEEEPMPAVDCSVELEATEIGVSEDTITVIVMADVDNALAPGLFQGAVDGARAWAEDVNNRGGIACRQVEMVFHDTMLNPTETVNGFLRACESALSLVGTTVLWGLNVDDLNSCPDSAGNPTGVPDIAYITTEPAHQCSTTSVHVSRPGSSCPYDSGLRDHTANIGAAKWLNEQSNEPLHGVYLIPADLPSTVSTALPLLLAQRETGVDIELAFGVAGAATQAEYAQYVQPMRELQSNYVYNGSNDQAMLKMIKEANAQGLDTSEITWLCTLSCYTTDFLEQGGDVVEGTYLWLWFLPFDESDTNDELAKFMGAIDDPFPAAWAAGAWAGGVLFEQAVTRIAERDGANAITRQALLDELATFNSFNVNGWWADADLTRPNTTAECFVLMQVQNGEYVRVHPAERGVMDCSDGNVIPVQSDPATFEMDN